MCLCCMLVVHLNCLSNVHVLHRHLRGNLLTCADACAEHSLNIWGSLYEQSIGFCKLFRCSLCNWSVWCLCGVCMGSVWCVCGVCVRSLWCLCGVCMVSAWGLYGVCVGSAWCL